MRLNYSVCTWFCNLIMVLISIHIPQVEDEFHTLEHVITCTEVIFSQDFHNRRNWYKKVVKSLENVTFALTLFLS